MKKLRIAVVVSAYNEEEKISRCLSSVSSFADEIVVIDNSSTDKTKDIAKKFTQLVFTEPNHLMLNINKNIGFSKTTADWILNLDADEEVTPQLAKEIQTVVNVKNSDISGYFISRKNIIFGKWVSHGLWWPDKQLRLFKKEAGKFPCIHIHEYIAVVGKTMDLKEPYIHHNYETVSQYLTKLERCTTSEALALIESDYRMYWYDAIRFPISDFIKIYFAQNGYKDGLHGLVLSLFQAFYSFVVFVKVWEKKKFVEFNSISLSDISTEGRHGLKDLNYWFLTKQIEEERSILKKSFFRIIRKLKIATSSV